MEFQNYPFFYLFFLSAIITGYISWYAWKRRDIRSVRTLSILMALVASWTFFYGFEVITDVPDLHFLFLKLEYLAIPWISGFLVLFALEFGGYTQYLTKKIKICIFVIPAIVFVGYFTNDLHHLYYEKVSYQIIDNLVIVSNTPGILYRLMTVSNLVAAIFCFIIILQVFNQSTPVLRPQLKNSVFTFLILIATIIAYFVIPRRYPDFDISPIFLSIIGLILLNAIFRYQFLDLMHIPYQNIFNYLQEGIIVLDPKNRILEINEPASELLNLDPVEILGKPLETIDSPIREQYPVLTGETGTTFTIGKSKDQQDISL